MRKARRETYARHVAVLMFLLFRDVTCKNKIKFARDILKKTTAHAQLINFFDQLLSALMSIIYVTLSDKASS